jgi:hypothetical protein
MKRMAQRQGTLNNRLTRKDQLKTGARLKLLQTKKSGLKVVTLIATLNPVSQVLW